MVQKLVSTIEKFLTFSKSLFQQSINIDRDQDFSIEKVSIKKISTKIFHK